MCVPMEGATHHHLQVPLMEIKQASKVPSLQGGPPVLLDAPQNGLSLWKTDPPDLHPNSSGL